MKINIADIINDQGASKWISLSKENMEIPNQFYDIKLLEPIKLEGLLESDNGHIYFTATLSTKIKAKCDRCMCDCVYSIKSEVTEDFGSRVDQFAIDMEPIIIDNFIISLPMKVLCSDDCKGICVQCGKDRNNEICKCDTEILDPRLEKLGLIFKDVKQNNDNKEG